jgi:hypothetical protein
VLPCLFAFVAGVGQDKPNATSLALADHPRSAGSASALLGLGQFSIGAAPSFRLLSASLEAISYYYPWPYSSLLSEPPPLRPTAC